MEGCNWVFNNLCKCPSPQLFEFCECIREEMIRWVKRHNDALKGNFTNTQSGEEVQLPVIGQQRKRCKKVSRDQ